MRLEDGNEHVIINMLSVMSFKEQNRNRNSIIIRISWLVHCSGIKNVVSYLSST